MQLYACYAFPPFASSNILMTKKQKKQKQKTNSIAIAMQNQLINKSTICCETLHARIRKGVVSVFLNRAQTQLN